MMLPILISVSVAPMSYFFCASAPLLVAARIARAAEKAPNRNWIAGILISLILVECVIFLIGSAFRLLPALNTLQSCPSRKSPLRRGRRGRHLVEQFMSRTCEAAPRAPGSDRIGAGAKRSSC